MQAYSKIQQAYCPTYPRTKPKPLFNPTNFVRWQPWTGIVFFTTVTW